MLFWVENWMYLIGIALLLSCYEYQCSLIRKSCIFALISRFLLSDVGMDDLSKEQ